MPDTQPAERNWIAESLRGDALKIGVLAVVFAVAAGIAAVREPRAASTAQLVLTTIPVYPENQSEVEDVPSRLLAEPLDVKSASILCTSDEAFRRTREALGENAPSLASLRGSLRCEISIAEESPMDIVYSPILKLHARAAEPEAAKRRVDAWSAVCVELAREYKAKRQGAIAKALRNASTDLRRRLEEGEQAASTEAYMELRTRAEFARIGADGEPPELEVLSPGAVWPVAPAWRAAAQAALAGFIAGLATGAIVSVGLRCVARFGAATA